MKAYYIRLITSAISTGISINTFCVKHSAKRGALRSMIFKLWNRCKLLAVKTITVKKSDINGIYDIIDNSAGLTYQHTKKVIHTFATVTNLTRAADFHGFKVIVLEV